MTNDEFKILAQQIKVFDEISIGSKYILKNNKSLKGGPMINLEHANCGTIPLYTQFFCLGEIPNIKKGTKGTAAFSAFKKIESYRVSLFSKECIQRIRKNKERYDKNINRTFRDLSTMERISLDKLKVLTTFWRIKNDR